MTLREATDCLERKPTEGCKGCPLEQCNRDCFAEAMQIGVTAIRYLQVGEKLRLEAEGK